MLSAASNWEISATMEESRDGSYSGTPLFFRVYDLSTANRKLIGTCVVYDRNVDPVYSEFSDSIFAHYELHGLGSINSLFINEEYQGAGWGGFLLDYALHFCYTMRNLTYMEVDDTSDFMGTPESIYYKAGFRCDSDDNHMIIAL